MKARRQKPRNTKAAAGNYAQQQGLIGTKEKRVQRRKKKLFLLVRVSSGTPAQNVLNPVIQGKVYHVPRHNPSVQCRSVFSWLP